jgi:hypothetical protein
LEQAVVGGFVGCEGQSALRRRSLATERRRECPSWRDRATDAGANGIRAVELGDASERNEAPRMAGAPKAGATGLEPATSGVPGRRGATGYHPESRSGAGVSSPSEPAVTGSDRLPPGGACVAGVWSTWCPTWTTVSTIGFGAVRLAALAPRVGTRPRRLRPASRPAPSDFPPHRPVCPGAVGAVSSGARCVRSRAADGSVASRMPPDLPRWRAQRGVGRHVEHPRGRASPGGQARVTDRERP